MTIDFLDSADPAAELLQLRARCYQLMQLAEATSAVIDRERAEHAITRDLLAVALRRGDGAAAARLEQGEAVVRDLLAQMPSKEFAKDDRQQAVWRAKAWLVEVQK